MNEQVDRGALADFLKSKGYMTRPQETPGGSSVIRSMSLKPDQEDDRFRRPPPVTQLNREPIPFGVKMKRFLEYKGYDATGYDLPPEKPTVYKPVPVTDPRAPSRERISAGIDDPKIGRFMSEILGKRAPYPGLPALTPGPEIPTPELRPQEMLDRPKDYVPPPGWWQQVKDVSFLIKSGDLNATSIAARGLLEGLTFGNIDPIRMIEKISGVKGFAEEYDKVVSEKYQKRTGYTPTTAVEVPRIAGHLVGALAPIGVVMKGVGTIAKGLTGANLIRKIPAIQALLRAELGGAAVGLAARPSGEDTLGARIQQVPKTIMAFTAFEAGALTAKQIISMLKWSKTYGTAQAKGTWAGDYYDVDIAGGTQKFTTKQLRELFLKTRNPGANPTFTEAEQKVLDDLFAMDKNMGWGAYRDPEVGAKGFESAAVRAAKGQAPFEEGLDVTTTAGRQPVFGASRIQAPRKPRFFDIFRDEAKLPKYEPFAPNQPGSPKPPDMGTPRPGASNIPPEPPPGASGMAPPPPGRATGGAGRPQEPRTAPGPTPRSRGGAPAVIVDVKPNPAGGWTYDFKIPQPEVVPEASQLGVPRAPRGPTTTIIPPGKEPIVTPAPAIDKKPLTRKELRAKYGNDVYIPRAPQTKWKDEFWQILSDKGGVKPDPSSGPAQGEWTSEWMREVGMPMALINTWDPNAKYMDEMVMDIDGDDSLSYNFDGYPGDLAEHIAKVAKRNRDKRAGRKDPTEKEYNQNEVDNYLIDQMALGNGDQLDPELRLRADELAKDLGRDFDPNISLEDGVTRMQEALDARRAELEEEVLMEPAEEDLPDFVTKDLDELLGPEEGKPQKEWTEAHLKEAKAAAIKKIIKKAQKTPPKKYTQDGKTLGSYEQKRPVSPERAAAAPRYAEWLKEQYRSGNLKPPDKGVKEFRLIQQEFKQPAKPKPAPTTQKSLFAEEPPLLKPKAKYPEGFNDIGWKTIPDYQNVIAATKPATAAGFNVDYGPFGKEGKGYIQIRGPKPGGGTGTIRFKSKAAAPPEFGTKAGQLGLDEETSGRLFDKETGLGKKGLKHEDLLKMLDKLNIPAEHRGEISASALEGFDPKKGNLEHYTRKIISNIKKRTGDVKGSKTPKGKVLFIEGVEGSKPEPGPGSRFANAESRANITAAVRKIQKNDRQGDIALRRIHTNDTFAEIGERYDVDESTARKIFDEMAHELSKDPDIIKQIMTGWKDSGTLGFMYPGKGWKWEDIKRGAERYFTTKGGVSKDIDVAHDKKVAGPIAELFQATLDGKIVDRWIRKNDNAGLRNQVKELLTGERSMNDIVFPENVPIEAIQNLRNQIDSLSDMIMLHGGLEPDTVAAFEAGIGKYLGGFYRLYEQLEQNRGKLIKKYWDPPQDVRDRYAARLRLDDPALYGIMTREEMDKFLDATLRGEDFTYKRSGRSHKVPTEHYKQKKDLSPEFREFAGPIVDPVWLALKTVTKQSAMAYNAEFLNSMEDNPIIAKQITFDERKAVANGWQNHKLPNDYGYGRLRGAWVDPDLHAFIQGEVNPQVSATEKLIMKFVMNPYKWTNTIGSIPAHPRNFSGNPMFSFLMRDSITNPFNIPYFIEAFRIFWWRKGKFRNEWADLIKTGITENQFWKAEIPEFYNELLKLDPAEWPEKISKYFLKKPIDLLGTLYNFEDQLYRISAHLKNTKHYGMTPQESVDDINLSSPNYAKVPIFVEWLRKYPVLGPFISFKYNVARILINNAIKGGKDIASKDPKRMKQGALRLYRLAFVIGLPLVLAKVAQKVFDVDPKEAKALDKFYPKHKTGSLIVYYREKDGKLKGYDFTYTYPTGDIIRAVSNLTHGDYDSFIDSTSLFAHPIFDAFQVIVKGRDPYFGTPIEGGLERKAAELVKLLWLPKSAPIPSIQGLIEAIKTGKVGENLRVGSLTTYQMENLIQAYHGQEDRYGRVRKPPEELKGFFTGVKTWDVDPDILIAKYLKQKQYEIDDIQSAYQNWLKKNTKAAYWQEEQELEKLNSKIAKIMDEMAEAEEARSTLTGVDYRTKNLPADVGKVKR